ncbi:PIN domain protein [archaeon]|nr:PIN domain protein [archaeon]
MRFLDVGVILCVALKQPEEYFKRCVALLNRLKGPEPEEVMVTTFLTPSVLYFILDNREKVSRDKLTVAIKALNSLNIKYLSLKDSYIEEAAVLAERYDIDFDDAVNVVVMREEGIREIYALDNDYEKIEWVTRVDP